MSVPLHFWLALKPIAPIPELPPKEAFEKYRSAVSDAVIDQARAKYLQAFTGPTPDAINILSTAAKVDPKYYEPGTFGHG